MISCFLVLGFLMISVIVYADEPSEKSSPDLTQLSLEDLMEIKVERVVSASKYEREVTEASSSSDLTQLSIEQLMEIKVKTVYSASKYEQKVTEAPSSVSIITADQIKKYGYRTLADILKSVRSFYITNDRNYSYVGVRGFGRPGDYNSCILFLVDGHRLNDNIYDGALIGTEFILDVDLIERIEIIRGPGSSLYGSNAFFAVVNIITKRGRDLRGAEISGAAASFDTFKGRLSYGNKFQNGMEMLISGSLYDSKGQRHLFFKEFDDPATNNGIAENADGDKSHSFFTKMTFHDFTLTGAYNSREKNIPTASYGTLFNDPRTHTVDAWGYVDLKFEHNLTNKIEVMARAFYDSYHYRGDYIYDYPPVTVNKDFGRGEWWGAELQYIAKLIEKHKIIAGAEYRGNIKQDQGNYDEEPYVQYLNDKRKSKNWAMYLQDEFAVFKHLILNLGLRYDHYDIGENTSPRFALIYNPVKKTSFKLIYGEAFRVPNTYELFYQDNGISQKANPELKPEKIKTYELVYEQYFGDNLRSSVSGFYYKIHNLISQVDDPVDVNPFGEPFLIFQNVEEIEAKGIELELEGKWADKLEGRISYTYQETKDKQSGDTLTNSPKHLAKLNVIIPILKQKLFAGTEVQYMSKRKTLAGKHEDDFFVTNVTLFSQSEI